MEFENSQQRNHIAALLDGLHFISYHQTNRYACTVKYRWAFAEMYAQLWSSLVSRRNVTPRARTGMQHRDIQPASSMLSEMPVLDPKACDVVRLSRGLWLSFKFQWK